MTFIHFLFLTVIISNKKIKYLEKLKIRCLKFKENCLQYTNVNKEIIGQIFFYTFMKTCPLL